MISSDLPTKVLFENDKVNGELANFTKTNIETPKKNYKMKLLWPNIVGFVILHLAASYGLYLSVTSAKLATNLFAFFLFVATALTNTAGFHRLWSHKSYKAKWQLRLLLAFFGTIAAQGRIILWARNHRLHHKYSDTNADPHSANRGFFFSHMGWLLCDKHPDLIEKQKQRDIDISDLFADPILKFQFKYYFNFLLPICYFVIPTAIPVYFWNETYMNAFFVAAVFRQLLMLQDTFLVNSVAHFYGNKPYDKNILPVQNIIISILSFGEGWHNYHHAFPWDYKDSELSDYRLNLTNAFIDFMAWIGWAYDLKTASPEIIKKRVLRTGDGSHEVWGWGDKDITEEDKKAIIIS